MTNFCDSEASQLRYSSPRFSDLLLFAETAPWMMPPLFLNRTDISRRVWTYVQAERLQYVLFFWLRLPLHGTVNPESMALGEPGAWLACSLFCKQMLGFLAAFAQNVFLQLAGKPHFSGKPFQSDSYIMSCVHWQNALEGYQTLKDSFFFHSTFNLIPSQFYPLQVSPREVTNHPTPSGSLTHLQSAGCSVLARRYSKWSQKASI